MPIDEAGKYEIDFRLRQKEGEFQQAIVARATASRSKRSPTTASWCRASR